MIPCPPACWRDEPACQGATFIGAIEMTADPSARAMPWREGKAGSHPRGVNNEDESAYRFAAQTVNNCHGLRNGTLSQRSCDR